MKWLGRAATRWEAVASSMTRCRNQVRGSAWRSWLRYWRLSAEQEITGLGLVLTAICRAIAASHGCRSSSVSGVPARIFATLAAGWNSSASR
jgi:hypothetical protein